MLGAPLLLAAAVGVPYAATNGPDLDSIWKQDGASGTAPTRMSRSADGSLAPGAAGFGPRARQQTIPLQQALNFNVSKGWVYQRWDRKTTALSELDLYGVRVPLVTGTSLADVAGSLTYYFDEQGLVQRIALVGRTGNTTQLEQLATQQFGLQRQATPIAGQRLYQLKSGDKVFGELRLRPSPVIMADDPYDSFSIDLQLQRPGTSTPLPNQQLAGGILPSAVQPIPVQQSTQAVVEREAPAKPQAGSDSVQAYTPRSRVPKKQVENLDRRGRFW